MLVKEIKAVLGGDLGQTSKMPGKSFGLSTDDCSVGSKLREVCGSVCESCYARRLENFRPNVRKGHESRTVAVLKATESREGMRLWVDAVVERISKKLDGNYFRWHDSGDILNIRHLDMINRVAHELPHINFWLPTKEQKIVREFMRNRIPANNLMIRVSSPMVDGTPPRGFRHTSTVHKNKSAQGYACPVPEQDGECKNCRACWSHDVLNVSYHKH